ncbi:DNA translocase FtsK [Metabacillus litoralis]|uniref:DNA translocase FtsK n=1 Tax=Metabacillus litoralis TaxID=152268 RepID=UPI002040A019|nr:DNA translocase FtsK [Metabacillus litoralis]MCM3650778.1 FtsK/SpoIIIE domain-containing protein [Metabacillus litoralis]
MNWLTKLVSLFGGDDEKEVEKDEVRAQRDQKVNNIHSSASNTDSLNQSNHKAEARVAYQYPKGNFKFPLIPDEKIHRRGDRPTRTPSTYNQSNDRNGVAPFSKRTTYRPKTGNELDEGAESKRPYQPTVIPSPVYGLQSKDESIWQRPHLDLEKRGNNDIFLSNKGKEPSAEIYVKNLNQEPIEPGKIKDNLKNKQINKVAQSQQQYVPILHDDENNEGLQVKKRTIKEESLHEQQFRDDQSQLSDFIEEEVREDQNHVDEIYPNTDDQIEDIFQKTQDNSKKDLNNSVELAKDDTEIHHIDKVSESMNISSRRFEENPSTLDQLDQGLDQSWETELIQESDQSHETELIQESDQSHETELIQESDQSHEAELIQESDQSHEIELIQKSDQSHEIELIQESDQSHEIELIQKSDQSHEIELIQESDQPHEIELIQKSDQSHETELIQGSDQSHEIELIQESDQSHEIELIQKSDQSHEIELIQESDQSHETELIQGSDQSHEIELIQESDQSHETELIQESDQSHDIELDQRLEQVQEVESVLEAELVQKGVATEGEELIQEVASDQESEPFHQITPRKEAESREQLVNKTPTDTMGNPQPVNRDLDADSDEEKQRKNKTKSTNSTNSLPYNVMMLGRDKQQLKVRENSYQFPLLTYLNIPEKEHSEDQSWLDSQRELLDVTLKNFNVRANVVNVTQGPAVTRFEVHPEPGVKVNKITNLSDDIKLSLAAKDIRIEAPIPGKNTIGIEVPNKESKMVYLREILRSQEFRANPSPMTAVLGLDISGQPAVTDLKKMPHGLIAGATGSGKSVCINTILVSLLYKASPHEVKLMLIDPKMVELAPYNDIPHLVSPVITDVKAATAALKWAVEEMERRYELFVHSGTREITKYNQLVKDHNQGEHLPYLVIIIDELADLMMVAPNDVEEAIARIAQKARACGIHLIVATQRPSVDVITGLIKANIPTRIAFSVSSQVDSRTILDVSGAEKLLGKGDMLFLENGSSKSVRLQGSFVSDEEIERVVKHVKQQSKPNYLFHQDELVKKATIQSEEDELFLEACEFVVNQGGASSSLLQRRFRIGYNRAARLIDMMEEQGIISENKGSKPRDILISEEELDSIHENSAY